MPEAETYPSEKYWRIKLISPNFFYPNTLRPQPIGILGSNLRVAGKLKSSNRFATQSWRISRANVKIAKSKKSGRTLVATNLGTAKILQSIRSNHGRIIIKSTHGSGGN